MDILIVDSETTGLPSDAKAPLLVEMAGCLFNVESRMELATAQCLIYQAENPMAHLNGISAATLAIMDPRIEPVARVVDAQRQAMQAMWDKADFVVAHNKEFDRYFFEPVFGKPKAWRCSKNDVRYPKEGRSKSLLYLAADHGIFCVGAHRALNDVATVCALFKLVPDLEEQLSREPEEQARYEAQIKYEENHLAKERGFKWDPKKRCWYKALKTSELATLPFKVQKA